MEGPLADRYRSQLAKGQASKAKALKPPPLPTDAQPAIEAQQTVKEPAEFWPALAEEDGQDLLRHTVNKILKECLCLIEKGCSADKIHSTLEKLIQIVPDAKQFEKYWMCRMRLERFGRLEKVMAIYEEALLARVESNNELHKFLIQAIDYQIALRLLEDSRTSG